MHDKNLCSIIRYKTCNIYLLIQKLNIILFIIISTIVD
nr:MAG TPA: hypothetical protein [Caudoviricetes sp.]DAX72838.1 MAG TPA: hypothetical protein [Caudoviricetes sp.]